jgi:hypothetical protein
LDVEIDCSLFKENSTKREENETDDLIEGENRPSHSKAFNTLDLVLKDLSGKKNRTLLNCCN